MCNIGVGFEEQVKPIITNNCAAAGCHPQYVEYNAARSAIDKMIFRIEKGTADPLFMPKNKDPLKALEIRLFKDWKLQGLKRQCDQVGDRAELDLQYLETYGQEDFSKFDQFDRASIRHIWLGHLIEQKEQVINAINKGLNSLSRDRDIFKVSEVDELGALVRVDLDAYNLTATDWRLIEDADEFNFESFTTRGVAIKQLSGARKPWLHADNFLFTVFYNSQVYYDVTDTPAHVADFLAINGVDFVNDFKNFEVRHIGGFDSRISREKNRLTTRHDTNDGGCWITWDTVEIRGPLGAKSLLTNPLLPFAPDAATNVIYDFDASEVICFLPNGLFAWYLANAAGLRQDAAPQNIVQDNEPPVINSEISVGSCSKCHRAGFIQFADEIRSHVIGNNAFDRATQDLVERYYKSRDTNTSLFAVDNRRFEQTLQRLGINPGDVDPINGTLNGYRTGQNLKQVANRLFLNDEKMRLCIEGNLEVGAEIRTLLSGGTISIDQLNQTAPLIFAQCNVVNDPIDQ